MSESIMIHESSGNVFADLGLADPDECLAKSDLVAQIQRIVEARGLSQIEAGKILGLRQPKVSALFKGRLDGFSTDRLFSFLTKLGCDIEIKVSRPHAHAPGHLQVLGA